MGIFDTMLTSLVGMDFFSVLFPFLLALAIFYAILTWAAKDRLGKGPIGLISIILAFFVMLYAKQIPGLAQLLTMGSGWTLAIASIIIFIIIIFGLFGIKLEEMKNKWVEVIIVLVVVYIIVAWLWGGALPGFFVGLPWLTNNTDIWSIILFIVIIAIAWHFLSREEKKEEGEGAAKAK